MTYDQITVTIDEAAKLAAQSAVDAHGPDVPSPELAWDFINAVYDETNRPVGLPAVMPNLFKTAYWTHVNDILRKP